MKQLKSLKQEEGVIHPSDLDGNHLILAFNGDNIPLTVTLKQDKFKVGSVIFCKLGNSNFQTGKYYSLTEKTYDSIDGPVHYVWSTAEMTENGVPGLMLQKATTKTYQSGVQYYLRNLDEFTPLTPVIGNTVTSNTYEDSVHFKIVQHSRLIDKIQNVMIWWCDPINIYSDNLDEACVWSKTIVSRIPSNIVTRAKLNQLIAETSELNLGTVVGGSTVRDQYAYSGNDDKPNPCFVDTIPYGETSPNFTSVYYVLTAMSRFGVCHHEFVVEVQTS